VILTIGIKYTKTALASTFEASHKQVDYALNSEDLRTSKHSESKQSNPQKLTKCDLDRIELFLIENRPESHELT